MYPLALTLALVCGGADGGSRAAPDAGLSPPMITEAECVRTGGKVFSYDSRDRHGTPHTFTVCRAQVKDGSSCRDSSDCGDGRCFCVGVLDGPNPGSDPKLSPLDGKPATGRCVFAPIPPGEWRCLVKDGKALLHGIIVD